MNSTRCEPISLSGLIAGLLLCWPSLCPARDIYVNPVDGANTNPGTKEAPLSGCKKAVALAKPGDVIHLLPAGSVFRQSIVLSGKKDLVIEGNGVTLDGADPIPKRDWEEVAPNRYRRRINRQRDRYILVVNGKAEKMGRSAGKLSPFPPPEKLKPGQFCYVPIDEKTGWLYVVGSIEKLEWARRESGLGTRGECSNIRVHNLNARHFLNDGFNIHGRVAGMKLTKIQGYDCFDEGFSAHDFTNCEIEDSSFWGCDRAVADVHGSVTHYRNCKFQGSSDIDVHFRGRRHSLTNCKIINNTNAAALVVGPPDRKATIDFSLKQTQIDGKRPEPARIKVTGSEVTIENCVFKHVDLDTSGSKVTTQKTTIDGPWRK